MSIKIEAKFRLTCDRCGNEKVIRPEEFSAICNNLDHEISIHNLAGHAPKWGIESDCSDDVHLCPDCMC